MLSRCGGRLTIPMTTCLKPNNFNQIVRNNTKVCASTQESLFHKSFLRDRNKFTLSIPKYVSRLRRDILCSSSARREVKRDFRTPPEIDVKERFLYTSSTSLSHENNINKSSASTKINSKVKADNCDISKASESVRENVVTIPNMLCVSRIVAAPYIAHVVINLADFPWALAIFGYAGVTDAVRRDVYC